MFFAVARDPLVGSKTKRALSQFAIEYSRCPGCSRCSRCTRCLRCSRCKRCTRCRVTSRRVVSRRRSRICIFVAVGVVVVVVVVGLRRAAASGSAYFHIVFVLSRPRFPSSHASVYDFTYFSNIRRNLHQSEEAPPGQLNGHIYQFFRKTKSPCGST